MSYIALARKWRPRKFCQLVGQEHVNKALIKSLAAQRVHHAYLFTGTRGVGKTSVARLLAKSLNCEQGVTPEPCLSCDACVSIEQGRFLDLIEIDGASKTRVEDTREVLENVQYSPTNARYKIYLIDEVHMLSQHSFNALLKTLEEPPPHVKFLLATTDPQKLPITVLSRCLQFHLKPIQAEIIMSQLHHILNEEQLAFEEAAIAILAKAAHGSMRDALSLLDQVIACSDQTIKADDVKSILGYTRQDYALSLLQALANADLSHILTLSQHIAAEGGNFQYVLEEMMDALHQISITKQLGSNHPFLAPNQEIIELSQNISTEDAHLFYQIALKGLEEIHFAPTTAIGFEMTLLRMHAFQPATPVKRPALVHETGSIRAPSHDKPITLPDEKPHSKPNGQTELTPDEVSPPAISVHTTQASVPSITPPVNQSILTDPRGDEPTNWSLMLGHMKLTGLALSAAEHAEFSQKEGGLVILKVANGHLSLFTPTVIRRIEKELSDHYKEPIKLKLNSDDKVASSPAQQKKVAQEKQKSEAEQALQTDPFFQALQQEFSGELVKDSISSLIEDL
ncbi:DNA polymerase III subunit gamma/tau [Legionella impletisoli]|uniref:DNA polymerase III subunit gamma/tau n=1 Tax=Legionella impletisoli TaxID=343510 RepID=A0A917JRM2_9GAMM|nr:DNA polymerase III subunit gamma/tau [Legionella impletisoli]GGI83719.1 DNA polymerase III, subunit gamma and tau [Legionella impletisoli]